ncbi:MAG TPA: S9 family peptidase [Burkholderiaceae bacterium]|jgi:dipeptidyl aminopeptidase/acylaminoacyl peptidase
MRFWPFQRSTSPTFRYWRSILIFTFQLSTPLLALAAPIPVEDLFRNADVVAAELSPDGKFVALTTAVEGRRCLAVMDLATRSIKEVASFEDAQVGSFRWISNERLVFSQTYLFDEHAWTGYIDDGLYAVNRDGSQLKELMSTVEKQIGNRAQFVRILEMVGLVDDNRDEIVAREYNSKTHEVHAYRLNTVSGRMRELDMALAAQVNGFWADHKGVVRLAATASSSKGNEALWYREDVKTPWRKLADVGKLDDEFYPIGFDADNQTLLVSSRMGRDKSAIYKYDFAAGKVGEPFFVNAEADAGHGLIYADDTHRIMGVRFEADQPGVHWFDETRAATQASIDAALPGQVNVLSGDEHAAGLLVHSYSDVDPGTYYYYAPQTHKLSKLFPSRPWLHQADLSAQLLFHYAARDGLDIPAYLTLPKGRPVKKLPLVVLVHGGPWARDEWGFDPEVQFLASRGYAVLQPQFRSSSGFGFTLFHKGWKQWGGSMQDDVTDGVQNLVKQGVVDSARVCIMGGSYGGYAAMMGPVRDPTMYRCAVDMFGVTDIKLQHKLSDWSYDDDFLHFDAKELIGDLDKDSAHLDEVSPLKQAAKIRIPVLMVYGDKDNRVPIEEGERLRDALQKNGTHVEWLKLIDEGHGIHNKEANRYLFYGQLDSFLKKYNPAD